MSSDKTDPAKVFSADNFTTLFTKVDPATFFNARCVSKIWLQRSSLQKYMADRYGFPLGLFNIVQQPIEVMRRLERLREKKAPGLKTIYLNACERWQQNGLDIHELAPLCYPFIGETQEKYQAFCLSEIAQKSDKSKRFLAHAAECNNEILFSWLLENDCPYTPQLQYHVASSENPAMLQELISREVKLTTAVVSGAMRTGNLEFTTHVLNARPEGGKSCNVLAACFSGNLSMVCTLVSQYQLTVPETALFAAILSGSVELSQHFIEQGQLFDRDSFEQFYLIEAGAALIDRSAIDAVIREIAPDSCNHSIVV